MSPVASDGVEAGVAGRLQRRLDVASLLGRDRVAFQAAFAQQLVAASRGLEAGGVVVDVQDAAPLQVEVDVFGLGHVVQVLARLDRQPGGGDGVAAVVGDLAHELQQPGILVPAEARIEQQRRVAAAQPAQTLSTVAALFQTSALLADSWPPLA